MRIIVFPTTSMQAISRIGAGVELFLVDCEGHSPEEELTHRLAAIIAVKAACATIAQGIANSLAPTSEENLFPTAREILESNRRGVAIWQQAAAEEVDPTTLNGRQIDLAQLYGPAYRPDDDHLEESRIKYAGYPFDPAWTLTDAFVSPPYGPPARGVELQRLWVRFVDLGLGRPGPDATIFRWDGDWSQYFDAGREWWGAAAWTITRGPREIVVACASTTD